MSDTVARRFDEDGYVVVRGVLDPEREIDPVREAYTKLIDALGYVYLGESYPDALASYDSLPFPQRFAVALGASGGGVLHHLDPVLNIYLEDFQWRRDLPTGQFPELFFAIRNARLLDILESLIGPEILASPIYHVNLKLAQQHLAEVERVAKATGQDNPALQGFYNFQVGKTDWHMDAVSGLPNSHSSRIVNAWIPLTEATGDNGCLRAIPGSHKPGVRRGPFDEQTLERAETLVMSPGDVLFLDNKVLHSSVQNSSAGDYRWALNFRYLPVGEESGRPFLPAFVARSRSAPHTELTNPFAWSTMWDRALTHRVKHGLPYSYAGLHAGEITAAEADRISHRFQRLAPDVHGWIRLGYGNGTAESPAQGDTEGHAESAARGAGTGSGTGSGVADGSARGDRAGARTAGTPPTATATADRTTGGPG